ncbi:hypothetical protein U1Q18_023689 [Sarracenia purpurea var. burkii]
MAHGGIDIGGRGDWMVARRGGLVRRHGGGTPVRGWRCAGVALGFGRWDRSFDGRRLRSRICAVMAHGGIDIGGRGDWMVARRGGLVRRHGGGTPVRGWRCAGVALGFGRWDRSFDGRRLRSRV